MVFEKYDKYISFYYKYKKSSIPLRISLKNLHYDRGVIKQLYSVGIPSSVMIALPSILISVLNSILVGFSEIHVSVLGIYNKLQTFIYLPAGGIVQGMRPIIGFNYGAGEKQRVQKTLHVSLIFAAVIMLAGTLLSLLMPEQLLSMFDADDSVLAIGIPALQIISLGFLVSSFGVIYSGAFEALGLGISSLIISLLRQLIIVIPLSILLSRFLGANGIWMSFPISEAIASVVAILLMRRTFKKI